MQDREVTKVVGFTLWIAFAATIFFAVFAIPLSYLLARKNFVGKSFINAIIDLPIVIPHTAAGIALLGFVARDSVLGKLADSVGLSFIGHPLGVAVAMAFVSLPFLIHAARDGFQAVPVRLEKAALNLGASPFRVFYSIALPLAKRNILSGLVMMFARGMSEFGAVVIIAYHPMIAPVLIYERFGAFGLQYARPVAVIVLVISLLIFILMSILSKQKHDAES